MEKLTITNAYGDSITFEQGVSGYMLISRGDFGAIQVLNSSETGFQQRGITVNQKRYGSKPWSLVLGIKGATQTDANNRINKILRLFEIEYTETGDITPLTAKFEKTGFKPKVAKCFVTSTPTIDNTRANAVGGFQRMLINLLLPEPVWKDEDYTELLLESIINSFEFAIDLSDSFEFGEVSDTGVEVDYQGDISADLIIEFQGLATNPILENDTYSQSLKLLTTITDGTSAIIDTSYENPRVEINDVSAFQYIDPANSDLNMTLRRGTNLMKFSTDDTSPVVAVLKYKKTYLTPLGDLDD